MILNIETSSKICSVALSEEGAVWYSRESDKEMDHSTKLAPFVEDCIRELEARGRKLEAVSVSIGPGSYTGLRIGLSLAKGLCFGRNLPLIGIPTLELLTVKAMFSCRDIEGDELYIPMIDARRMEVYTAVYNGRLELLMEPSAVILDEDTYSEYQGKPLIMVGDGVEKARKVLKVEAKAWLDVLPKATDMTALSEKYFREGKTMDIAYSTPFYLKSFQATVPKKKIF